MPKGVYYRGRFSKWENCHGNERDIFWSRVNKNGPIHPVYGRCWMWIAARYMKRVDGKWKPLGYGMFKGAGTHRTSYRLTYGDIPKDMFVLHKCDNPGCVNPGHLFLGTPQDNMTDKKNKGRWTGGRPSETMRGEKNTKAVLTEEDVRFVKSLKCKNSFTGHRLAYLFKVNYCAILSIWRGKTWAHVK